MWSFWGSKFHWNCASFIAMLQYFPGATVRININKYIYTYITHILDSAVSWYKGSLKRTLYSFAGFFIRKLRAGT